MRNAGIESLNFQSWGRGLPLYSLSIRFSSNVVVWGMWCLSGPQRLLQTRVLLTVSQSGTRWSLIPRCVDKAWINDVNLNIVTTYAY